MSESSNIEQFRRRIPFTIDGQPFTTDDLSQRASALLRLVGLDPAIFNLGELVGKEHPQTKRFHDDEIVSIVKDARFVSIRQSAPVGIVKLTDCNLFLAFLHEAKPLKLRKAAIDDFPRFRSESG